ncbi:hypothetical protein ACWDUC_37490 [Streptomyces tricolor]
MPLVTRERARSLFSDLTHTAAVPLDPDELLHMPGLRQHGHVFFGDIAVRAYKHKARWMYDERDIRAAARTFAEMSVDLDDVVDVELPRYRDVLERDAEEWSRPHWRRQLMRWMFGQARQKAEEGKSWEERDDSWKKVGANGLPGDLTCACSRYRHSQNIAGTRPLQLLTWSGESWLLPRAYTELLDRWQQREEELTPVPGSAPAGRKGRTGAAGDGTTRGPGTSPCAHRVPGKPASCTPATCAASCTSRRAGATPGQMTTCAGCVGRARRRPGITATTTAMSVAR